MNDITYTLDGHITMTDKETGNTWKITYEKEGGGFIASPVNVRLGREMIRFSLWHIIQKVEQEMKLHRAPK